MHLLRCPHLLLALLMLHSLAHAQQPAGFDSAEAAFQATFIDSGAARRSYQENREFAAALYLMPDGRWYATRVAVGGRTDAAIPYHEVPDRALRIAGVHTHGAPAIPEDPGREYGVDFSALDRRNAMRAYQLSRGRIDAQWLVSSRLEVLRMTIALAYAPDVAAIRLAARTDRLGGLPGPASTTGRVIAMQRGSDAMDR